MIVIDLHALTLGRCKFAFPTLTRLFKMLIFLHVGNYASFFTGLLEALQCLFKWLIVTYQDTRHAWKSPLSVVYFKTILKPGLSSK